jgi:hypothetical protein
MADMDGLDLKPWQRMPEESAKAYHAFTHFLTLLPHERSMGLAYTTHQKQCRQSTNPAKALHASPEWQAWRFRFSWKERVASHDAEMAEADRLRRVHEISEMNGRHTAISVALQNLVVQRLQEMAKTPGIYALTPVQMATLMDKAALIERRSRGEATSIVKHTGDGDEAMALDLSKLSEAELEVFQSLVAKAEGGTSVSDD